MQQHAGNTPVARGQSLLSPSGLSGWRAAALAAVPGCRYRPQKSAACFAHGLALTHTELVFALLAVSTGVKSNAVKNTAPQSRPQPQPQKEKESGRILQLQLRDVFGSVLELLLVFSNMHGNFSAEMCVLSQNTLIFFPESFFRLHWF